MSDAENENEMRRLLRLSVVPGCSRYSRFRYPPEKEPYRAPRAQAVTGSDV